MDQESSELVARLEHDNALLLEEVGRLYMQMKTALDEANAILASKDAENEKLRDELDETLKDQTEDFEKDDGMEE